MKMPDFEISSKIETILRNEFNEGNSIVESYKGWSDNKSTLIILEKPFSKRYAIKGLTFKSLNDLHYWKEEYQDRFSLQTIACKF